MAPQSRGKRSARPPAIHSASTPNLHTLLASSELSSTTGPPDAPPECTNEDVEYQSRYLLANRPSSSSSSESSSSLLDVKNSLQRHQSLPQSSHTSFLGPNAFAPPFYNRPPTPLPPSPSLTFLLRPSFSIPNSHPTTPDSSEGETPNDTEAAVAKSARTAATIPRASPKVPTYEYYGFVLYLVSSIVFLLYLLWSYLPTPALHAIGLYYYPSRWWSLAIPSFLVMLLVYIYVALASYNTGYLTLPMASVENIVDDAADIAIVDSLGRVIRKQRDKKLAGAGRGHSRGNSGYSLKLDWKTLWNEGTDAVMDVPLGGVCEVLYGQEEELEEEEQEGEEENDDDGQAYKRKKPDQNT
ncbi:MAG: hypothetical protein M1829_000046 [Trizodia sp. TS-e1964]|nr:MAG: hypothetical protein M1829_000046 [Trizodia sp. TS-e1964]